MLVELVCGIDHREYKFTHLRWIFKFHNVLLQCLLSQVRGSFSLESKLHEKLRVVLFLGLDDEAFLFTALSYLASEL